MCAAAGSRKANGGAHQSPHVASRVAAVDLLNPLIFFQVAGRREAGESHIDPYRFYACAAAVRMLCKYFFTHVFISFFCSYISQTDLHCCYSQQIPVKPSHSNGKEVFNFFHIDRIH